MVMVMVMVMVIWIFFNFDGDGWPTWDVHQEDQRYPSCSWRTPQSTKGFWKTFCQSALKGKISSPWVDILVQLLFEFLQSFLLVRRLQFSTNHPKPLELKCSFFSFFTWTRSLPNLWNMRYWVAVGLCPTVPSFQSMILSWNDIFANNCPGRIFLQIFVLKEYFCK